MPDNQGLSINVQGHLVTIPFGIKALKHDTSISHTFNLSKLSDGTTLQVAGTVSLHLAVEDNGGELDADIKLGVMGLDLFDKKIPLLKHIENGTVPIHAGGGQLTFTGQITVSGP